MLQQLEDTLRRFAWLQDIDLSRAQLLIISLGIGLLLLGLLRLLRHRRKTVTGPLLLGVILPAVTLAQALITHQFRDYQPLLPEREVLEIAIQPGDPGDRRVTLKWLDGQGIVREWRLDGDAWQLSARVIRLAGVGEPRRLYRFQHLIRIEAGGDRRAHRLLHKPEPDLWQYLHDYLNWLPGLQAERLYSESMPVQAGRRYRIALLPGLIRVTEAAADNSRQLDSPGRSP